MQGMGECQVGGHGRAMMGDESQGSSAQGIDWECLLELWDGTWQGWYEGLVDCKP